MGIALLVSEGYQMVMSGWINALACSALFSSVLAGEIVMEFDGKEWNPPEGSGEITGETLKDGVCFLADANVPAGAALKDLGLDQLLDHPVRFALRGQEGQGASLDPIAPGKEKSSGVILVICDRSQVAVSYVPSEPVSGLPPEVGFMTNDFEGLDEFLAVAREGVKKSESAKEVPRMVLIARSTTSFGHMARVLQLVRTSGCRSGLVKVDDEFPSLDIEVLPDPEVTPPVARIPNPEPSGRIVVNIREDGSLTTAQGALLADEQGVTDHVDQERRRLEKEGLSPKLHLRGDRNSVFKHARGVIRAAAKVGVDQVIFAVYEVAEGKPKNALKMREQDLGMTLPKPEGDEARAEGKEFVVVKISIDQAGGISMQEGGGILDKDAGKRELPLLKAKLEEIAGAKGAREKDLRISMWVDPLAAQQRVIDVLNLLAQLGISSVTFTDTEGDDAEK